jgi:hypothetical protein
MSLSDQLELASLRLTGLGLFEFLCRPALREGEVSKSVIRISIDSIIRDTETTEYVFPDQELVEWVRSRLAARGGIPAATILAEQEAQNPGSQTSSGFQPSMLPDGRLPEQHKAKTNPTLPTLEEGSLPDEEQRVFLSFLVDHPDTPISSVYKALGLSGRKGNDIRERLNGQGCIQELEVRTTGTGAGRPLKFVIPTLQALEFLEKEPPSGRGGVTHRHVQHLVADVATAKGYTATCEKALGNGGIVDVHLEKGAQRIAVEIAIASTPERESTHIRNCLEAGYDHVYALFAGEDLLERIEKVLQDTYSQDVVRKVRLLPLSKLSHVG